MPMLLIFKQKGTNNDYSMKIFETQSSFNGPISVYWDLAFGKYIKANGLTQSGGIVKEIWKETLVRIKKSKSKVKNCLILGLGGGSAAMLVQKCWPEAKITGVDIDPMMIELGKKYLGLDKIGIEIKIEDAYGVVNRSREKYELIFVDVDNGYEFPEKFNDEKFIKNVKKVLNKNGAAIFNRFYGGEKRGDSLREGNRLEKEFRQVEYFYPQANLELICYN